MKDLSGCNLGIEASKGVNGDKKHKWAEVREERGQSRGSISLGHLSTHSATWQYPPLVHLTHVGPTYATWQHLIGPRQQLLTDY
jgi:hypothetical protein